MVRFECLRTRSWPHFYQFCDSVKYFLLLDVGSESHKRTVVDSFLPPLQGSNVTEFEGMSEYLELSLISRLCAPTSGCSTITRGFQGFLYLKRLDSSYETNIFPGTRSGTATPILDLGHQAQLLVLVRDSFFEFGRGASALCLTALQSKLREVPLHILSVDHK